VFFLHFNSNKNVAHNKKHSTTHALNDGAEKVKYSEKPRTLCSTVCKKTNIRKSHAHFEGQWAKKTNIQKSHAHFEAQWA